MYWPCPYCDELRVRVDREQFRSAGRSNTHGNGRDHRRADPIGDSDYHCWRDPDPHGCNPEHSDSDASTNRTYDRGANCNGYSGSDPNSGTDCCAPHPCANGRGADTDAHRYLCES